MPGDRIVDIPQPGWLSTENDRNSGQLYQLRLNEEPRADMMDSARHVENLMYTYAEFIDAGDLDGVAALFEHGRICGVEGGPPETVFSGTTGVRKMYEMATRLYDDGTPMTKHLTSNVQVYVDDDVGTARASANYCVTQATPDLPLQIIVTGHYRDTFHRIDGCWWFDSRTMFVDQIGDLSHHLKF